MWHVLLSLLSRRNVTLSSERSVKEDLERRREESVPEVTEWTEIAHGVYVERERATREIVTERPEQWTVEL